MWMCIIHRKRTTRKGKENSGKTGIEQVGNRRQKNKREKENQNMGEGWKQQKRKERIKRKGTTNKHQ